MVNETYDLLIESRNSAYYFELVWMFVLIFLGTLLFTFLFISIISTRSICRAFKYKNFLSDSEIKEIVNEYKNSFVPRLLTKLL